MAAYVELYVDQGTDWSSVINLTDDTSNTSINIDSYIVRGQLRRSYYSANATANIVCQITDESTGEITMSLSEEVTSNIKAGRYLFDIETVDTLNSNTTTRVLEGIITVTPGVTR